VTPRAWRGALIGCGFFAPNHLNAWASIPAVNIRAVCDLESDKARALGQRFGVPAAYGSAADLLKNEELDFVDIVTTAGSHRALVELAAGATRLIICQKPCAESLEDADAMVEVCRRKQVALLVHENFRWQQPFREIAARAARGAIGRPWFLRLTFRHAYDIYRQQPYLAQAKRLAIMDVGLHLFDLARYLMGEVVSIHCRTQRLNPAIEGEDAFTASLEHDSGAITTVECSFFARHQPDIFPQTLAWMEGEEGALELLPGYELKEHHADTVSISDVKPPVPSWGSAPWHAIQDSVIGFQHHVVDVLEGRTQPQPSGADNRKTLAVALAAYQSAAEDRVIHLSKVCT
jgi:predicted dehydrogenase